MKENNGSTPTPSTTNGRNPNIIEREMRVPPVKQAPGNPTGEWEKGYKVVKKITDRPKPKFN